MHRSSLAPRGRRDIVAGLVVLGGLGLTLTFGCTITYNSTLMNRLSLGMTKQEVIAVMGQPHSSAAAQDAEYLRYDLYPPPPYYTPTAKEPYYVRLTHGKVDSYGRVGDFDSTKDPTLRLLIHQQ